MSFTTQERDNLIDLRPELRTAIERVKDRFFVGLHHNWHDYAFVYDPLFDFSMAGEGDLIERTGKQFPQMCVDACNFTAPDFQLPRQAPFWDVLHVARAVSFKGIPEFLAAIRKIYDDGHRIRVLYLCPVPPAEPGGTTLQDIRQRYEGLFAPHERTLFTLMTMEWGYPFPLDMPTLAHFYRSSRVFVHAAPEERRCRTAAYAWASRMPVVAGDSVASILPEHLRRAPFWFRIADSAQMADAIVQAVKMPTDDAQWTEVQNEFTNEHSAARIEKFLGHLTSAGAARVSAEPINVSMLDIRLGRHHLGGRGPNGVGQLLDDFIAYIAERSDGDLKAACLQADPEREIAEACGGWAYEPARAHVGPGAGSRGALMAGLRRRFRLNG